MRNKILIIIFLYCTISFGQPDVRKEINIPDILEYKTLKADFHMHTVFSDGYVWPTVRVEEAWIDGLDVISITDHVEYLPHKNDVNTNRNRSYEIATNRAKQLDIILIKGGEITKAIPPGHFNTLFINDVEALNIIDPYDAIKEANNQNAIVFWNHPGWREKDEIPIWRDFQEKIYNDKMIHGIEIVNVLTYYPLAFKWALEKDLIIFCNSDVHSPTGLKYDNESKMFHRPITLVFAKARTKSAIREALENRRTAAYYEDKILGKEQFLKPLFDECIEVKKKNIIINDEKSAFFQIRNKSEIDMTLIKNNINNQNLEYPDEVFIPSGRTVMIKIKGEMKELSQKENVKISFIVKNFMIAYDKYLEKEFEIKLISNFSE